MDVQVGVPGVQAGDERRECAVRGSAVRGEERRAERPRQRHVEGVVIGSAGDTDRKADEVQKIKQQVVSERARLEEEREEEKERVRRGK